jgi:hypothetical protein
MKALNAKPLEILGRNDHPFTGGLSVRPSSHLMDDAMYGQL